MATSAGNIVAQAQSQGLGDVRGASRGRAGTARFVGLRSLRLGAIGAVGVAVIRVGAALLVR
jgi:hypothetical protein